MVITKTPLNNHCSFYLSDCLEHKEINQDFENLPGKVMPKLQTDFECAI